jgi:hypothetical protein
MIRVSVASPLLVALVLGLVPQASAQHQHAGAPPERLGKVHFETSCSPAVAAEFDRGLALLHSFWFRAATESFNRVSTADPNCAMAWWGVAMSQWGNPFGAYRSPAGLKAGSDAVAKARALEAKSSPRERAYIAAVATLFANVDTVDQRTRTLAYEHAMADLVRQFPGDTEAAIFYALALDQTALPSDKTYKNQLAAAEILEREFKAHPDHPGVAHYLIHTYDSPALAGKGLDAARRYAGIAPSAPHALHMPSHTFTRVGSWQESIDTNQASAEAARADGSTTEELHAYDYQVYAYLQTGQDAAARRIVEALPGIAARFDPTSPTNAAPAPAGFYALAAIPARYTLERGAWSDAAAIVLRPSSFAYPDAVTHYARALGAARSGQPAAARTDLAALATLRDALTAKKDTYWAEQVEIQRRVGEAWTMFAEGKRDEALTALGAAADMEDKTEKAAVSPGPLAPAREQLGEMLLEAKRPADALAAFEASMKKEPNRFRGLQGATRAAQQLGDTAKAKQYAGQLVAICVKADAPPRQALEEIKKVAAR